MRMENFLGMKRPRAGLAHRNVDIPASERYDGGEPAFPSTERYGYDCLMAINGGTYIATVADGTDVAGPLFTITIENDPTGNSVEQTASGLVLKAGDSNNSDVCVQGIRGYTPASGKKIIGHARFRVDDADKIAVHFGVGATGTEPLSTAVTDLVGFQSTSTTSGLLTGVAKGNGGTQAATGTLATVADSTFVEVKFLVYVHATTPSGYFEVNGTRTNMTTAQLSQVAAILTTPQTMYAQFALRSGEAAVHNATIDYAYAWGER